MHALQLDSMRPHRRYFTLLYFNLPHDPIIHPVRVRFSNSVWFRFRCRPVPGFVRLPIAGSVWSPAVANCRLPMVADPIRSLIPSPVPSPITGSISGQFRFPHRPVQVPLSVDSRNLATSGDLTTSVYLDKVAKFQPFLFVLSTHRWKLMVLNPII